MTIRDVRDKIAAGEVRAKHLALFCLTVIALVALIKMDDPENILINVIVAISAMVNIGDAQRRTDKTPQGGKRDE